MEAALIAQQSIIQQNIALAVMKQAAQVDQSVATMLADTVAPLSRSLGSQLDIIA